jgi:hypothetical protein
MRATPPAVVPVLFAITLAAACGQTTPPAPGPPPARPASHAVFAEFARDSNKLMKNGLNRRIFNVTEAHAGSDITLGNDGYISLEPGTYRISGFSTVSMQTTFAPPTMQHNNNYPGYCMLYPRSAEAAGGMEILKQVIAIGSPHNALDMAPSLFDVIYTVTTKTDIALGHQSGEDLHDEVYLSVYEVEGTKSEYHVFARIAITRM